MDFHEIFRKCSKWDTEQVITFLSDLGHCIDHLDPGRQMRFENLWMDFDEIFRICLKR